MKNNRQNRKLNFIRTKNGIRKGMSLHAFIKCSTELKNSGQLEEIIAEEIEAMTNRFSKQYKTPLKLIHQLFGQRRDDFAYNITTLKLTFKKI